LGNGIKKAFSRKEIRVNGDRRPTHRPPQVEAAAALRAIPYERIDLSAK
jgi:hypothetical protein